MILNDSPHNETMMQYFEWYLPNDGLWWRRCGAKAENLAKLGVTAVWLPPAYKGCSQADVGYGVYDMYDLGEFDQKGTVRTKYGTKEEYAGAIHSFHLAGIRVFADIVLNHRLGGDESETVMAVSDSQEDRNVQIAEARPVKVLSRFTFPGRGDRYSNFKWNYTHFTGTDFADGKKSDNCVFRFEGKEWNTDVDSERGNFDYLMGMNVDTENPTVIHETRRWLMWYVREMHLDGLRLDAVKHISFSFYSGLLHHVREKMGLDLPAVGEYWSGDVERLQHYLDAVDDQVALFDVSLHYNFYNVSQGRGCLKHVFDNTLVTLRPEHAVTFVDNHDTQHGQSLESFVDDWFKPIAYSMILLRKDGVPCVFYSDYYGNPVRNRPSVLNLGKLMKACRWYAYGEQVDYFEDDNRVGWVRKGDFEHENSGLAVVASSREGGSIRMEMGNMFVGKTFYDVLGKCSESVTIDDDGFGEFRTEGGSVSVWLQKPAFEELVVYD